jgi:hypothetical protein
VAGYEQAEAYRHEEESMKVVGMTLMFAAMVMTASASITVPEIDASSGASALALLSGSLLVIRSRRKK